jgi:hypothetical protein
MPGGRNAPGLIQSGRIGRYKGVIPNPGAPIEVYDLAEDIGETRDLAPDRPDLARQFLGLFDREHEEPGGSA